MIFNEDTRVKIPATLHFLKLGYNYQSLKPEDDIDFRTKIFKSRFKKSLEKINKKTYSDSEIETLLLEIHNVISNNDMGKEFYNWLINPNDKDKLIDFDNIENNDFSVVDELPFSVEEGIEVGSFRPDINILVNGMPLAFLEVKKPYNDGGIKVEFDRMVGQRLKNPKFKKHFNMLQLVCFSNNMEYEETDDTVLADEIKCGSFYTAPNESKTTFSFFRENIENYHRDYNYLELDDDFVKKTIVDLGYPISIMDAEFETNSKIDTPCNKFITSMFDKQRFMFYLQYGIVYVKEIVPEKHIMRYPQFFAINALLERLNANARGGIIWHTQGSGKTALSCFSNRILKDYYSKQGINIKFFFVVDRLDLLNQAKVEFEKRGYKVITCKNKEEFKKQLNTPLSTSIHNDSLGEIIVVNIQKFTDDMPVVDNPYNIKVQRIFFVDEAHRSYNKSGVFFRQLMSCDKDGVFIALTGTPLLTKAERTDLKFGEYIHKYFFDMSIADGYTLRIKKEPVQTKVSKDLKKNLKMHSDELNLDSASVFESAEYISYLGKFIEDDFENFRALDNTVGGMIVCRSNEQAKKMTEWLNKSGKIKAGLVIHSENEKLENQYRFKNIDKNTGKYEIDMLVVHYMLTTGFDAKRLKKLYLLRGPKAESLLQTISRVNRPYVSPMGRVYKYGYIMDFIDITREYQNTVENYMKELEKDLIDLENENGRSYLTGLIVDKEIIYKNYLKYLEKLALFIDITGLNRETFQQEVRKILDKPNGKIDVVAIRDLIKKILDCCLELKLSNATEYLSKIDKDFFEKALTSVNSILNYKQMKEDTSKALEILSNEEIIEVIYTFIRKSPEVIDLRLVGAEDSQSGQKNEDEKKDNDTIDYVDKDIEEYKKLILDIKKAMGENKNKKDSRYVTLAQRLTSVFSRLSLSDRDDLKVIQEDINALNKHNEELSSVFDNHFAFIKTISEVKEKNVGFKEEDTELLFKIIFEQRKKDLNQNILLKMGERSFIDNTKSSVTKEILKEPKYRYLYKSMELSQNYNDILHRLYINLCNE